MCLLRARRGNKRTLARRAAAQGQWWGGGSHGVGSRPPNGRPVVVALLAAAMQAILQSTPVERLCWSVVCVVGGCLSPGCSRREPRAAASAGGGVFGLGGEWCTLLLEARGPRPEAGRRDGANVLGCVTALKRAQEAARATPSSPLSRSFCRPAPSCSCAAISLCRATPHGFHPPCHPFASTGCACCRRPTGRARGQSTSASRYGGPARRRCGRR